MTAPHLDTKEKAKIVTLAADGQPPTRIAKQIGRSPHTVRKALEEPEIQRRVRDEKAVLAEKYREQTHRILDSINDRDIEKASLQNKAVSAGIFTDKALLLSGEATDISAQVSVLLEVVDLLRDRRDSAATVPCPPALPPPDEA